MTLADLLRLARRRLSEAGIPTPDLDARLLVEHFSGTTRADAIADPGRAVPSEAVEAVESALARRIAGEPVHRILGFREFYGLRLSLSPDTLEPRPDTETLVDALLPFVRETTAQTGTCRILDLGTGTGAIALALLAEEPWARAIGVDISEGAVVTARANALALGLADHFSAFVSDWFANVTGRYHAIASNPPYISTIEIADLDCGVRDFDPVRALDGGSDGLDAYRRIAAEAAGHLEDGGVIGVEIGAGQGPDVTAIFDAAGYDLADARRDLSGHERALVFRQKARKSAPEKALGNPGEYG